MPLGNCSRVARSMRAGAALRLHQAGRPLGHQRVQVRAVDQVQRIDHVAPRFRHLVAFVIADQAMHVHLPERHIAHELKTHHHHAGHPEEQDIEAGHQHRARIKARKLRRFLRPAQGGEGPQRRREPSVQHVIVAAQGKIAVQLVLAPRLGLAAAHVNGAVLAVPSRNPYAPTTVGG